MFHPCNIAPRFTHETFLRNSYQGESRRYGRREARASSRTRCWHGRGAGDIACRSRARMGCCDDYGGRSFRYDPCISADVSGAIAATRTTTHIAEYDTLGRCRPRPSRQFRAAAAWRLHAPHVRCARSLAFPPRQDRAPEGRLRDYRADNRAGVFDCRHRRGGLGRFGCGP